MLSVTVIAMVFVSGWLICSHVFRTPNIAKKTSDVESDDNSNDNDWTYNGSRKCTLRYVIPVS